MGSLTYVRRAVNTPDLSVTQCTYTARRQVQQIIPPAGGPISFTYNTVDDQVTKTDG